ncbi:MAG: FAD-dependent oxidoreductase, partial [Opitutales bacterium]
FTAKLPKAGKHEVFLAVVPNANRATKAKVRIIHAGGQTDLVVNLTKGPADHLVSLGTYDFSDQTAASVIISNEAAEGYVVIDAVNWQAR